MFGPFFKGSADCECCETNPPDDCYACPCLVGESTIRLIAPAQYVELENTGDDGPESLYPLWGDPRLLMGIFKLQGSLAVGSYAGGACRGCWLDPCYSGGGLRPTFVTQICPGGGLGFPLMANPLWAITVDTVAKRVNVYLTWNAQTDCDNSLFVDNVTYIRWPFEWPSETCDDVMNLTWTGEVYVNNTVGAGGLLEGCCTCPDEVEAEFSAADGDVLRFVQALGSDPDTDLYWKLTNLFSPPRLELDVSACVEPDCCAEEGGGPTASFDYEQENCQFVAHDTSTPGTCGAIVRRLWELEVWDADPGGDPDEVCPTSKRVVADQEDVTNLGAGACGNQWMRLTLHVWDEVGCHHSATSGVVSCCNCEDGAGEPCGEPDGSLIITLIDADTCTYELEASAPDQEGTCSDTVIIEWRLANAVCDPDPECSCQEIDDGDCGGLNCSGGLGDGQTTQITIDEPTILLWRAREGDCGCAGPWHEEELPCGTCSCCEGKLAGAMVTVAGIADCPDEGQDYTCGCDGLNQEYDVPKTESCGGTKEIGFGCNISGTPVDATFTIGWVITCDEFGYWLTLSESINLGGTGNGTSETVFLGEEIELCEDVSGCVEIDQDVIFCIWCNNQGVSMCATLYKAAP